MEKEYITNSSSDRGGIQTSDPVKIVARPGYKHTKLGWIPEEWETPRIDEVFDFLSTNSLSRNQLNYEAEEGVYNIHYGDIHATYKQPILDFDIENRVPKINKDIVLSQNTDFLKDADLIIADASEDYEGVGKAIEFKNISGKKVISGLHTFAFRDKSNKTVEGFRVYIFRNPLVKKALKTIATGSKVFGISKGNIQKFRIVLPPLPEQQKIATILATWDRAIAKQQQLIAAKQQFKKGLMQLLLTGKKRFAGFEGEWETKHLNDIFTLTSGKTKPRNTVEALTKFETYPVYGGNGITGFSDEYLFEGHKILIGRVGEYCGVVHSVDGKYWITDNCLFTNSFHREDSKYFFFYLLTFLNLNRFKNKGGQPLVSQKPILGIKVKVPQLKEQQKIATVISTADKEITLLQKQLVELQGQKRGLMQGLLTGAIRVKL